MKKNKEVTIYDLAKKLNYSPSTISRALNDHKSISQKTKKEIEKAAKKMGYHPNSLAASLRSNKSKTLGVMVARINSPFMAALISGVEETARKAGYNIIISQSNDNYENEVNNTKTLYNSRISGLIVSLGMETEDTAHFKQFTDKKLPIVFVDRVPNQLNSYRVIIDNYSAGYRATQHLINEGCRRIAHFAGAQHLNVYNLRKKGYLDALRDSGLKIEEHLMVELKTMSSAEGREATKRLLNLPQPPDGIFSANDTAAVSAILTAKEKGIDIPGDLAVIGFNDDPVASIVEPSLSTVSHPAKKMGEIAAQRILDHENASLHANISEISMLDTEVIVRNSSRKSSFKDLESN